MALVSRRYILLAVFQNVEHSGAGSVELESVVKPRTDDEWQF